MSLSIRWKLILSIGLPLVLTYAGMLAWDYMTLRREAIKSVQDRVADRAEEFADRIDAQLRSIMALADSSATFLSMRSEVSEFQIRPLLLNNLRLNSLVFATWVASVPSEPARAGSASPDNGPPPPPDDQLSPRPLERPLRRLLSQRSAWMVVRPAFSDRPPADPRLAIRMVPLEDDYASADWFTQPRDARKPVWLGPIELPHLQHQRVCLYAAPFGENDTFRGVVVVAVRVQDLQSLLEPAAALRPMNRAGESPTSKAASTDPPYVLIDKSGRILSTPAGAPLLDVSVFDMAKQHDQPQVGEALKRAIEGRGRIVRMDNMAAMDPQHPRTDPQWIAFSPISATGWVFATATPEAKMLDPVLHRLTGRGLFLLQGLGLMIAVVLFASIRIVRPIEHMAAAVDQLAAGNLDTSIEGVNNRDELGRLARGFNAMIAQLRQHVAQLTAQTAAREKVESELRIARQIQTDLLPRKFPPFPERVEFDLHGVNIPARSVAGDFFDYFLTDAGRLMLVVADVSGKGVPAAILMAVTRTIVRDLAMAGLSVAEIARRANDLLMRDSTPGMFVTLWLGQYDTTTGELIYVNAGHPLPYRFGPSCPPQPLGRVTAPLLGVEEESVIGPIEQDVIQLAVGQSILLYTDGVTEARSPDNKMLRDHGVEKMLAHYAPHDPPQVCLGILRTLEKFQASHRHDDVTLVVLRRNQ